MSTNIFKAQTGRYFSRLIELNDVLMFVNDNNQRAGYSEKPGREVALFL